MRIHGQQLALEMATGAPDFTQGHLQRLALGDGVALEQLMNGKIARDKGQAVRQFEALLA